MSQFSPGFICILSRFFKASDSDYYTRTKSFDVFMHGSTANPVPVLWKHSPERDCELGEINLSLFAINSLRALGGDLRYRLDSSDTAFQFGVQLKYTSGTCFFEKTTFITGKALSTPHPAGWPRVNRFGKIEIKRGWREEKTADSCEAVVLNFP